MNKCPICGQQRRSDEKKCPECDVFYSKIDEFLAEEEARDEQNLFKTRLKRIRTADDWKHALKAELKLIYRELPKGSMFVLYVVIAFVFLMSMAVL